jgi:hypothetical protein
VSEIPHSRILHSHLVRSAKNGHNQKFIFLLCKTNTYDNDSPTENAHFIVLHITTVMKVLQTFFWMVDDNYFFHSLLRALA